MITYSILKDLLWKRFDKVDVRFMSLEDKVNDINRRVYRMALFGSSVSFRSPARGHLPRFSPRKEREAILSSKIAASDPSRLTEILPADPNKAYRIEGISGVSHNQ